ncbi:MAG TPA: hypothetical protein VMT62_06855 [Syntrophorhabdaceae bacterium]|nr:hypothetical protein [Syntrophorhabdaceae bacterium]
MRRNFTLIFAALIFLTIANATAARADIYQYPSTTGYSVTVTVTQLGGNSYSFDYAVTNMNQGTTDSDGYPQGLSDFYLQVPDGATLSNIADPQSYYASIGKGNGSYWTHGTGYSKPPVTNASANAGYSFLGWYAQYDGSPYPTGTTVHFTFDASGVTLGVNSDYLTTYWGPYTYSTELSDDMVGPAATPIPPSCLLFAPALGGLVALRRRFRK